MLTTATAAVEAATAPIRAEVLAAFGRAGIDVEHVFTCATSLDVAVHVRVDGIPHYVRLGRRGWSCNAFSPQVPTADEAVAQLGLCAAK